MMGQVHECRHVIVDEIRGIDGGHRAGLRGARLRGPRRPRMLAGRQHQRRLEGSQQPPKKQPGPGQGQRRQRSALRIPLFGVYGLLVVVLAALGDLKGAALISH